MADAMTLAEAIERVRLIEEDGCIVPGGDLKALAIVLAHAKAWRWCVENEEAPDPARGVVTITGWDGAAEFRVEGPDLPSAVAAAREKLEGR